MTGHEEKFSYSATLYEIKDASEGPVGKLALNDRLVPLDDFAGGVEEIFEAASERKAEAISIDPFEKFSEWRDGERITFVRSPVTGNWYEHIFEWDPHPFVGWLEDTSRLQEPNFRPVVEKEPFRPVGIRSRHMRERVHVGVFYRISKNLEKFREEDEREAFRKTKLVMLRAFSSENREKVRQALGDGNIERIGGLEAPLGEVLDRAKSSGAHIVRTEGPLGYFGERIKNFVCARSSSSTTVFGWGRHPYLPGFFWHKSRRALRKADDKKQ